MIYAEIVMIQGEEGREYADRLFNVDGVVAHGATAESIEMIARELSNWDDGEMDGVTVYDSEEVPLAWTPDDKSWEEDWQGTTYILSGNLGLGHVSLARKISE